MSEWRFRPARDHGLTLAERVQSYDRERGLGSLITSGAWRLLCRLYLRVVHRLSITGMEHLPPPPFVIVANHSSHLDALTLASSLPWSSGRKAFALAAGDTFFTSTPASVFAAYAVNALPVWRKKTKPQDLDDMRRRLTDDGGVLILFPEGTRTRDGTMARFRPGVGSLVAGRPIPVVPCWIEGAFAAWPATAKFPRPGPLRLIIGEPLLFTETAQDRAGMVAIAEACEAAVRGLAPKR
ncbi:MAG: lysophospholipid acyltransferase family protein [Acetobacteraceae bacterium]